MCAHAYRCGVFMNAQPMAE